VTDAVAGGATVTVAAEFVPARAVGENNPVRPAVGTIVIYNPSHGEFAGGYAPLPAIVVTESILAVIDASASMTTRPMPICRETWEAAGADHAFAHWEFAGR